MRKIYLFLAAAFVSLSASAQIAITVTGNTNTLPNLSTSYPTLTQALTALNGVTGMSGPVVFTCTAGSTETAPAAGFTIGSASLNAALSVSNTFTLTVTGGTATLKAATSGTATPSSSTPDGILKIVGADYVTINGLTFTDENTTNPASMEYGIGLFKRTAADGAQNNRIQNCIVNLPRVNNAGGSAPMFDGSVGILVLNATPTAATTVLTPSAASGTNSGNKFYSNTVTGGTTGIGLSGYAATTGYPLPPLGDLNNDVGGAGSATATTGNIVLNYGGGTGGNPAAGIRANNQWGLNISNNIVNNNNGSGVNHNTTLRGIYGQAGTSANVTISYNTVMVKSASTTSALNAIENGIGSTAASNTVNISNNLVQDCAYPGASSSGEFRGIYNTATATTVNITSNRVIDNSVGNAGTNTSCTFTGIWPTGSPVTVNISNNTVSDNTVANNFGIMYCIRGGSANTTANGNTVFNNSIPNAAGANNSELYGFYNSSSPTAETYTNNNVYNLSINGSNTANDNIICGIYKTDDNSNPITVSGNNVNNLSFSGRVAGSALVAGIRIDRGTTINVSKNVVHALSSTGPSPTVAGIYTGSSTIATTNAVNNIVGNLETPNSTGHNLFGIYTSSGGTNLNFYYNTVFLNAASTGSGFSSSAFYMSSNTPTVTLRNNLLVNLSTATGSGVTSVIRRVSNSLTGYGSTSNNNLVYAGVPSASRVLYQDVNSTDQTLASFKARVAPRESASVTDAVSATPGAFFQTLTGPVTGSSTSFLHIVSGLNTFAESGGANISGIADDYDGQARAGNSGYAGTGSAPDIGADEFDGSLPASVCSPVSVPYFEGFESITVPNALPSCVLASPAPLASGGGKTQTYIAAATGIDPALSPRTGNKFAAVYYNPPNTAGYFFTAPLLLTGGVTYTASVWYKTNGVDWTEAGIYYGTSPNAAAMTNVVDTVLNAKATVYTEIKGNFTPATTGVYYVGIRAFNATSSPNYIAFDDISVATASCTAPALTATTAITSNGATVNWNTVAPAPASYEIYYSTSNTAPVAGTLPTVTGVTGTSRTVTGLAPATTYYIWVRSNCGSGGVSAWSATGVSFTTLCTPVSAPYTENFDGATLPNLPPCTSTEDVNKDGATWATMTAPAGYSGKTLRYVFNPGNAANDWFFTSGISLTAGTSYTLTFKYGNNTSVYTEKLKVSYGTAPAADSMKNLLQDYPNITGNTVASGIINFSPTTTGVYYIGFNVYSPVDQNTLYLDDISLNTASICAAPLNVSVSAVAATSASVSWAGTGNFILEYGPAGFTPGTGTTAGTNGTLINPATSTQALSGLVAGRVYDVYVRRNCVGTGGGFSSNSAKVTFATLPANDEPTGAIGLTQTVYNTACTGTLFTTAGATVSSTASTCFSGQDDDVWFSFTATNTKAVLKVSNYASIIGTAGNLQYGIYSGTAASLTEVDCETVSTVTAAAGGGEIPIRKTLAVGQTYYVRVLTSGTGGRASFNLCVMTPDVALTTANSCVTATPVTISTVAGNADVWVPFYTADGKLVAELNAKGLSLGAVSVKVYRNAGAVRTDNAGKAYLDRNFEITPGVQPGGPVSVRLYFTAAEFTALRNKSGSQVASIGDLSVFKNNQACGSAVFGAAYPTPTTGSTYENNYYVAFDVPSFSSFFIASNAYSVLPANLLTFSGLRQGGNNVLKWTVAQEKDVQAYGVERSENGRDWSVAGSVNSLGNTSAQRSYSFSDNNIAGLKQYYRLRQVDQNGSAKLSNTIVISGAKPMVLALSGLFPNPASSKINVLVEAPSKETVTLLIMDAVGKTIKTQKAGVDVGSNTVEMNITGLAAGSYLLKVICESNCESAVLKFAKE